MFAVGMTMTPEMGAAVRSSLTRVMDATAAYDAGQAYLNFVEKPVETGRLFAPTVYRLGGAISLLTLAGLAGWCAWGVARGLLLRRRSPADAQTSRVLSTRVVLQDRLMPSELPSGRERSIDSPVTAARKDDENGRS